MAKVTSRQESGQARVFVQMDDGREVHFTFTHEGVIVDQIMDGDINPVVSLSSFTYVEMMDGEEGEEL